jgi:hypothetical protein
MQTTIRQTYTRSISIIVSSFLASVMASVGATTYYVSPSGDDGNTGDANAPFKTIQRAANIVNPGDTVIVRDGVYTNSPDRTWGMVVLTRPGNSSGWITFKSEHKWGAVLDGQYLTSPGYGFHLEQGVPSVVSYIRIQDFELKNFNGGPIDINWPGASNFDISGNHIHHIGRVCSDSDQGFAGMYVHQANSVVIEKNVIHDIGRFGPGENGCNPQTTYYQNHDHGIYIDGSVNVTVKNNIFYDITHGWGIQCYSGSGTRSSNLTIANNTFAFPNPYRDGQIILAYPGVDNSTIQNNIFYDPTTAGVRIGTDAPVPTFSNVAVSYNIVRGGVINSGSASGVTFSSNQDNTDPLLVNPAIPDFHLQAGSPAVNAGTTVSTVTDDMDGNSRPQGGAYDIGAYEQSSSGTTRYVPSQYSTIRAAYDACNPGDTIIVADGTYYNEDLYLQKSGTASAPIKIQAANTWGAVIDAQNQDPGNGGQVIYIEASYITIQGFELKNGQQGGITIAPGASAANHNQILQNLIHNNGNTYNGPYGQDGIYSDPNTSDNSYIGNFIRDNGRVSLNSHLDHGLYLSGDNEFVANNLIAANSAYGIQVSGANNTVSNLKIYNNVLVNSYNTSGIMLWASVSGVDIANNIIYGNADNGIKTSACHGSGVTIRNNLFYNNPNGAWDMTYNGSDVSYSTSGNITNSDPLFVNWWSDWHLQTGSPAINAGLTLSTVPTDFDGVSRPQGGVYDIGAYER